MVWKLKCGVKAHPKECNQVGECLPIPDTFLQSPFAAVGCIPDGERGLSLGDIESE